jgi:hypothetical protein
MAKITKAEKAERLASLKDLLKGVTTLYTNLRKVSASGMSREISVHIVKDGEILDISYGVSVVLGWPQSRNSNAIKVSGCGMDMGFHLVYTLAQIICDDGYALKQRWM